MKVPRKDKALSRDEDYRDYEERDSRRMALRGWQRSTSSSPKTEAMALPGANSMRTAGRASSWMRPAPDGS